MTTTNKDTGRSHGQRLQELRRSGASGKHGDRRTKRQRDRASRKRAALKEQAS
jgi:hypothetical protein